MVGPFGQDVAVRLWVAPGARRWVDESVRLALEERGVFVQAALEVDRADADATAAVLLLTPQDTSGPHRDTLMQIAAVAAPGRPVLVGGTSDRDTLLDAVNHWRVSRILAEGFDSDTLVGAVLQAGAAGMAEVAKRRAARALQVETAQLQEAIRRLDAARDRLLEAERLSATGRISSGLIEIVRQYRGVLDALERVARRNRPDRALDRQIGFAFDALRAIDTLLDEVNAHSEGRELPLMLADSSLDEVMERVLTFFRLDHTGGYRRIEARLESGVQARIDRARFFVAMVTLLRLVRESTRTGDLVTVQVHRGDGETIVRIAGEPEDDHRGYLVRSARNAEGPGPDERRPEFEVCRRIVHLQGGSVEACGRGRSRGFLVHLPPSGAHLAQQAAEERQTLAAHLSDPRS